MNMFTAADDDWINIDDASNVKCQMEKEEINACSADLSANAKALAASSFEAAKCATLFAKSLVILSGDVAKTAASATLLTYHVIKLAYATAAK